MSYSAADKRIFSYVTWGHVFVVFVFAFFSPPLFVTPSQKQAQMIVQTVRLEKVPSSPMPKSAPQVEPKKEKAAPKPVEKKEKTPASKKKPPAKPTKKNEQSTSKEEAELLAKFEKSLQNIDKAVEPNPSRALPTANIQPLLLSIDASSSPMAASYADLLRSVLARSLVMPEFGDVAVLLSIDASGKLVKFEIKSSQSAKNRAYILSELPQLRFPSPLSVPPSGTVDLSLVLSNEM